MISESHKQTLLRIAIAGGLVIGLAGCSGISDITGPAEPVRAEDILLRKAEQRVANAQDSLNDANELIAKGQRQRAEGEILMKEGEERIKAGNTLKHAAEQDLAAAQSQAAAARQSVQIYKPTEELAGAAPVPQSRPINVTPY